MILDEGIVGLLLLAFWIWALLDVISTDESLCRNLPKTVWLVMVLVLPDVGAIIWLLAGRPERGSWRPGSTDYSAPRRPVGLEDSPRYSASPEVSDRRSEELNRELERWEREQRAQSAGASPAAASSKAEAAPQPDLDAWQQQLDQREAELRRRELELRQRELDQRELEQRERDIDQ